MYYKGVLMISTNQNALSTYINEEPYRPTSMVARLFGKSVVDVPEDLERSECPEGRATDKSQTRRSRPHHKRNVDHVRRRCQRRDVPPCCSSSGL